jgi:isocitrate dehydrogenase kinase/phosphatase
LGDIQHQEQEVQLAHCCIFKYNEWSNIFSHSRSYLLVIEIDGGVPEVLKLVLPLFDIF